MMPVKNEIGNKYGMLTVVERFGKKNRYITWRCVCECGNEKIVQGNFLRSGSVKSCGCMSGWLHNGLPASNLLYGRTRKDVGRRGIEWDLTREFFREITSKNCYYCGSAPLTKIYPKRSSLSEPYYHNGIDRIDSNVGYTESNVVACCKHCNFAKNTMTQEEFYEWVRRVYEHNIERFSAEEIYRDA